MRLTGNEQHFELVTHALNRHHSLVVEQCQLIIQGRDFEFDHVGAAMINPHRHTQHLTGQAAQRRQINPITPHRHIHRDSSGTCINDAHGDHLILANNAETRCFDQFDPAITFAVPAGHKNMQGRAEAKRLGRGRHVMHNAIGDKNGAAHSLRRNIRQGI